MIDTWEEVQRLVGRVAASRRQEPSEVFGRLAEIEGWDREMSYESMTPAQVDRACRRLRATLLQLCQKGGTR